MSDISFRIKLPSCYFECVKALRQGKYRSFGKKDPTGCDSFNAKLILTNQ